MEALILDRPVIAPRYSSLANLLPPGYADHAGALHFRVQPDAPFGRLNAVLSPMLKCSPCIQYAARLVNGCAGVGLRAVRFAQLRRFR